MQRRWLILGSALLVGLAARAGSAQTPSTKVPDIRIPPPPSSSGPQISTDNFTPLPPAPQTTPEMQAALWKKVAIALKKSVPNPPPPVAYEISPHTATPRTTGFPKAGNLWFENVRTVQFPNPPLVQISGSDGYVFATLHPMEPGKTYLLICETRSAPNINYRLVSKVNGKSDQELQQDTVATADGVFSLAYTAQATYMTPVLYIRAADPKPVAFSFYRCKASAAAL